jgi:hypothetical protein
MYNTVSIKPASDVDLGGGPGVTVSAQAQGGRTVNFVWFINSGNLVVFDSSGLIVDIYNAQILTVTPS